MSAGVIRTPQELLRNCFDAAIQAVEPAAAMHAALSGTAPDPAPCWIISIGKAASGMARGVTTWLAEHGRHPDGGLIVAANEVATPDDRLVAMVGDHPVPGTRSAAASDRLGELVRTIPVGAHVHVTLSGGTSALIAAPLEGLIATDIVGTFDRLLGAGLDIAQMNAVRKRLTRWSAGRLALALPGRVLHLWAISDVPGDDLADLGSGPCTADRWSSTAIVDLLRNAHLWRPLGPRVQRALQRDTPSTDDPVLRAVRSCIIANNAAALRAAAACAAQHRVAARIIEAPLGGDATAQGIAIAKRARDMRPGQLWLWGGETTVTLPRDAGTGGRCQQLALAAARQLSIDRTPVTLLAAGTDGRDGPTDAAGAWVDWSTWDRIIAAGRDPEPDLARHDAYTALGAASALLGTGPTGTNVMDVVMALNDPRRATPE